ncbi:MAG: sterol desaturase family protein [Bdellovibrionales bacterium]
MGLKVYFSGLFLVLFSCVDLFQNRYEAKSILLGNFRNLAFGVLHISLATFLFSLLLHFPEMETSKKGPLLILEIISLILFMDFITYWWHRAYHKWPALWRLHKVHHSDTRLNTASAYRFHLGELFLSSLFRFGLFFLYTPSLEAYLCFELVYSFFNLLTHSKIELPNKYINQIEKLFITPRLHHNHHHHLREIHDNNFGVIFSIWDRVFGTFYQKGKEPLNTKLGIGDSPSEPSFVKLQTMPIYSKD